MEEGWAWRVGQYMALAPRLGDPACLCQLRLLGVVGSCQPLPHAEMSLWHWPFPRPSLSFSFPSLQRQVEVNVRNKILYLIQAWAHAFRNEPKYKVVQDTYQIMKVEGESEQAWDVASRSQEAAPVHPEQGGGWRLTT